MTLLKIARMGHPVLRRRAQPVDDPCDPSIGRLAFDMVETMKDAPGVGLAAPQVYIDRRVIVFKVPPERLAEGEPDPPPDVTMLVNPFWQPLEAETVVGLEGCLSIPGLRGLVPRFRRIRYGGLTPQGEAVEREACGFHARVVQHEIDHLEGILFIDRMTDLRTLVYDSEMHHLLGDDDGG